MTTERAPDHRRLCKRCNQERPLLDYLVKGGRIVETCARCREEAAEEKNMLKEWVRRRAR
jgi:hypothetical protein